MEMKNVLTIAGSDSSGGAGIQADLKTMSALGVYGMSVITAVTAQNTCEVTAVQEIDPDIIAAQIDAVFSDIRVDAVKVGMVSNADIIRVIRDKLMEYKARPIVIDPVMVSKSRYRLLKPEAEAAVVELVAIADVITPNIPEAEIMTQREIRTAEDMETAAKFLVAEGAKAALIKGGHMEGDAMDLLLADGKFYWLKEERIQTKNTHGTGCTLSSAIASKLALGMTVPEAVREAKDYVTQGIRDSLSIGKGSGPLGHLVELYRKADML